MPTEQTLWPENQAGRHGLGLIMGGGSGSGPPPSANLIELEDASGTWELESGSGSWEWG
jgi:hypothetical protein